MYHDASQQITLDLRAQGRSWTTAHLTRFQYSSLQVTQTPVTKEEALRHRSRWCRSTSAWVAFNMIDSWIQRCVHDHETCRQSLSSTKPARLLDPCAFHDSEDLRLVLTDEIHGDYEYATSSYRWFGTDPLTLKTTNYNCLSSRIRLETISPTIREAISVCPHPPDCSCLRPNRISLPTPPKHKTKTEKRSSDILNPSIDLLTYKHYHTLPFINVPLPRHFRPNNLITIQQAQRVKRLLQLAHRIDRLRPQLVRQVVPLHKPNAMLTRRRALELDGALDHVVDQVFGLGVLGFAVVQYDS